MESNWIEDWLAERAESEETKGSYGRNICIFPGFCKEKWSMDFSTVVKDWRRAKRDGDVTTEDFLDHWNDIVKNFSTHTKKKYAPLPVKKILTSIKS